LTDDKPKIGFLGLGYMGSRMAARLLDAGYPLAAYNRTPSKAHELEAQGATACPTPKELAAESAVLISCLADDAALEATLLGPDGALAGARSGSTLIEMSTVSPGASRRVFEAAGARGVAMLDAPVSGSTPQAEAGTLVIFVGGDGDVLAHRRPILTALGQTVLHMGPSGAGVHMKLVVNTLLGLGLQALAEALTLGEKSGLARDTLLDALAQTAHVSPAQKGKMENARRGTYPPQFPLRLMHKDFGLALDQAASLNVPMPAAAASRQIWAAELAQGREEDCSVVIRLLQTLAGLETNDRT